jgi:hypothetical protein
LCRGQLVELVAGQNIALRPVDPAATELITDDPEEGGPPLVLNEVSHIGAGEPKILAKGLVYTTPPHRIQATDLEPDPVIRPKPTPGQAIDRDLPTQPSTVEKPVRRDDVASRSVAATQLVRDSVGMQIPLE